ncbi:Uncharacterised protein [Vibrio cholerae]|nr:Uncharacterised protein [Vibrio cholerae]
MASGTVGGSKAFSPVLKLNITTVALPTVVTLPSFWLTTWYSMLKRSA